MPRRHPRAAHAVSVLIRRVRVTGTVLVSSCGLIVGCQSGTRDVPTADKTPSTGTEQALYTPGSAQVGPLARPAFPMQSLVMLTPDRGPRLTLERQEPSPLMARGVATESAPRATVELIRGEPEPAPLPVAIARASLPIHETPGVPNEPVALAVAQALGVPDATGPVRTAVPHASDTTFVQPASASIPVRSTTAGLEPTASPSADPKTGVVVPVKAFAAALSPPVLIASLLAVSPSERTVPFVREPIVRAAEPELEPAPTRRPRQASAQVTPVAERRAALPRQASADTLPPAAPQGNKPPRTLVEAMVVEPAPTPGNKPPRSKKPAENAVQAVERPALPRGFPKQNPPSNDSTLTVGGVAITLPPDTGRLEPVKPEPASIVQGPVQKPAGPFVGMPSVPATDSGIKLPVAPVELPPLPVTASVAAPVVVAPPLPSVAPAAAQAPLPFPTMLPATPGTIDVGGTPMTYDSLSRMVEGQIGGFGSAGCASCGGNGCPPGRQCAPGQSKCEPFPAKTAFGRTIGLMYENICCPDPCYQPHWEPVTATSFWADAPRPISQSTLRWDYAHLGLFPDRGEYFFARSDGNGKGPTPNSPALAIPNVDYHELMMVTEIAKGAFSTTIAVPYRSVNPGIYANSAAGFSDMTIATKSLLFDSELFMFAFQMKTILPAGNFRKGLGNGHVTLEPSAIAGLRFGPKTYGVAQLAEWIPIAGDPDYAGALLRWNFALNHIWWQPVHDVQLVGTMEVMGFSFQDGAYTDPVFGSDQKLSGQTFVSVAPGGRLFYCDKFDMGISGAFGVTGKYYAQNQIRLEFRYRY